VPERATAADALCGAAALDELPEGAIVGTASLRRRAQLLAARPDLDVRSLRGNVDTRLRRLEDGEYAAIVLAAAGLERLGRAEGAELAVEALCPAPGQGCLALEARAGDERAAELARRVTHDESLLRLTAERALVAELGATCRTPVGAHAERAGDDLVVAAFALDGLLNHVPESVVRDHWEGDDDILEIVQEVLRQFTARVPFPLRKLFNV
jgi:hydroxymethylbilane synthase